MATYTLPDLPYDYSALEPHISGEIMEVHHDKHHATYVQGANTALEQMAEAREQESFATIPKLEKDLAFNVSGHINHAIFWKNLSPDGSERPDAEMGAAIDEYFGSFKGFQGQFTAAATSLQGSGWALLTWEPLAGRLMIEQRYDQQGLDVTHSIPIVMLDMWEHAFYLQYKNSKPDYVNAWWNVVNWADAAKRLTAAREVNVP